MNTAICLTGLSRNYKECFHYIKKNIIDQNPYHKFSFYFATWDVTDSPKSYSGKEGLKINLDEMLKIINPVDYRVFNLQKHTEMGIFNLLSYKILPRRDDRFWDSSYNHFGLMQFFLKKECIKLLNDEIDNVLFLRFDVAMLSPYAIKQPMKDEIFVNIGLPCPPFIRCDDSFMYSNLVNAKKYTNVFKNSDIILRKLKCLEENERILYENLVLEKLRSTPLLLDYKKL